MGLILDGADREPEGAVVVGGNHDTNVKVQVERVVLMVVRRRPIVAREPDIGHLRAEAAARSGKEYSPGSLHL